MKLRRRLEAIERTTARRRAVAIDPELQAELDALPLAELRARREALLNDEHDPRTGALVARRRALLAAGRAA